MHYWNRTLRKILFYSNGRRIEEEFRCGAVLSKRTRKCSLILIAHIKVIYKDYERKAKGNQGTLRNRNYEISPVVLNIYAWIDMIDCGLKPSYTVGNDLDRWDSKLNPISYKTFMKYLELVTTNSHGKWKPWDNQLFIVTRQMVEMQNFLKLMMKENLKTEFS